MDPTEWSLTAIVLLFAGAGAVILVAGTQLTRLADRFADVCGWGEAITGAVLLGAMTSLAGSVTSIVAASDGRAELAVSNAVGGIAAQTVFLAVADITYRRVNLEHAAASVENLISGCILIVLLGMALAAATAPAVTVFAVHPATLILPAIYLFGLRMTARAHRFPMWAPRRTDETRTDEPEEPPAGARTAGRLGLSILALGVIVAVAGFFIAKTGGAIIDRTALNASIIGTLFTAISTSLPELVTTIVAVRRGALTLAVSGIVGGNTFDVLFIAFSDIAYREGSIYHAIGQSQIFILVTAILMTGILLLGLVLREREGIGNIGFESVGIIAVYAISLFVLTSL